MTLKHLRYALALASIGILTPAVSAAQTFDDDQVEHEWVVSGEIGSAFAASAEDPAAGFGGALTYLKDGAIGAEFLAGYTPDLDLSLAPTDDSTVNNFMVNGVAALPLGEEGRFQPFVSGGLGAMTIASEFPGADTDDLFEVDDTQLGGNVGVGLMAFNENWGVRSDLRYFTGFGGDEDDPIDVIDENDFLSDVDFWRANVGVAYRW